MLFWKTYAGKKILKRFERDSFADSASFHTLSEAKLTNH